MIDEIEKDKIAANYAEVFSSSDEFTVGNQVSPEEYLHMQSELRDELFEIAKSVIDFVLQDYVIVRK